MKKTTLLLFFAFFSSIAVHANDRAVPRKLVRKDINILLYSCSFKGNDDEKLNCYQSIDHLIAGDNIIYTISEGCGKMNLADSQAACFKTAAALINEKKLLRIAKGCSNGSDSDQALCLTQAFQNGQNLPKRPVAYVTGLKMIKAGCNSMSFASFESECFKTGLKTLNSKPNLFAVLSKMCVSQNDDATASCFSKAIEEVTKDRTTVLSDVEATCGAMSMASSRSACYESQIQDLAKDYPRIYVKRPVNKEEQNPIAIKEIKRKVNAHRVM